MKNRKVWRTELGFAITAILISCAEPLAAQFGGREGDTVLFVVTHHGPANIETVAPNAQNGAAQLAGYRATDVSALPFEEVVPNFPARRTQVARRDADDRFELITQAENVAVPATEILTRSKVFTMSGLIHNNNEGGKEPIYLIGGALVPFTPNVTIGSEQSLVEFRALFWRPDAGAAPFREVPPGFRGSNDQPGLTGLEYQQGITQVALLAPWTEVRKIYPNSNWPSGVFLKRLDIDPAATSTIQLLRLRPGRKTPPFRFASRTHLYVLEGGADIAALGGNTTRLSPNWHAYLPAGTAITLANPKVLNGPLAVEVPAEK